MAVRATWLHSRYQPQSLSTRSELGLDLFGRGRRRRPNTLLRLAMSDRASSITAGVTRAIRAAPWPSRRRVRKKRRTRARRALDEGAD